MAAEGEKEEARKPNQQLKGTKVVKNGMTTEVDADTSDIKEAQKKEGTRPSRNARHGNQTEISFNHESLKSRDDPVETFDLQPKVNPSNIMDSTNNDSIKGTNRWQYNKKKNDQEF